MTTLLIAEFGSDGLKDVTAKALTAARQLNAPVHILVAGADCKKASEDAAALEGVEQVMLCEAPVLAHHLAEPMAALILSIAKPYTSIVAAATTFGKNILPRVAARLDVMQVSDITAVVSPSVFERPIYAGNAIQTVEATDAVCVLTVRPASFLPTPTGRNPAYIKTIAMPEITFRSSFIGEEVAVSERPELTSAQVVVSGGRALGSKSGFETLIVPLADVLGAATGASRAAVDAGYVPNDWQVGQTGKVVAPDLYMAIGISGAIQHLAGMKDSKTIVAINKDGDAPIFQIADFGLVGDLFTLVPALTTAIKAQKDAS